MASSKSNTSHPNDKYNFTDFNENKAPINLSLAPYWFLVILRIALIFIPQDGYIHPDEYFQSLEILNSDIFNVASIRPWEFNSTYPIRSVALPYVVMGFPLFLLKSIAPFLNLWFSIKIITPYTLLVVPRLACCVLSFVTDHCMYRICCLYRQNYRARLLTLASSYVMLVYSTRTLTNSIELALASYLIYLVSYCMAKSDQVIYQEEYYQERYKQADNIQDKVKFHRLRLSLPWHTFANVFYIATVTVLGVFNRPTFFAFAFPPIFFWLLRGMGSNLVGFTDFNIRMFALFLCSIPSMCLMAAVDSYYYENLTYKDFLQSRISLWSKIVVTPFNFITYNLDSRNLKEHGIHPRYTHFLVNIPLLYNVLGVSGLIGFLHILYRAFMRRWSSLPRVQSIIGLMTSSFVIPITLLSAIPHQEPRFLIPVTLPLVFLHSQRIRSISENSSVVSKKENGYTAFLKAKVKPDSRNGLLTTWYIVNIIFSVFFGFVHQAGVYNLVDHFSKEIEAKPRLTMIHLVTSHMYPLPISLLQLKYGSAATVHFTNSTRRFQRSRDVYTYELGTASMESVTDKLAELLHTSEQNWKEKRLKYRLYYACPGTLKTDFELACLAHKMKAKIETVFHRHFSTEAMPYENLNNLLDNLSLVLYRLSPGET
ncbi:GPI mannosyltransferase 4 [Halyomorpha halys]|uniref:GPI mannosyltransferase 4 n=1 Tax=Halyomorpha halys TaxID=286706 RepID=UPI0006D4C9E0|nr:GPI mannosyltransferase 4 [Halyomorpha halys]